MYIKYRYRFIYIYVNNVLRKCVCISILAEKIVEKNVDNGRYNMPCVYIYIRIHMLVLTKKMYISKSSCPTFA